MAEVLKVRAAATDQICMTIRLAVVLTLVLAAPAAAVIYPPISLSTGHAAAQTAMHQVQLKTPGATVSGVSRCFRPKVAGGGNLVDCKGWVKIAAKPTCRLQVRVHESSEGPVWAFIGKKTCARSRTLSSAPGGVY